MRALILIAAALSLPLAACTPGSIQNVPASPSIVANATVLDEKAVIGVELAYTASAKAAALAIRTGLVTDIATIRRIGELDRFAYARVLETRLAYATGNAASYRIAFGRADAAVKSLLAAF